MGTSVQSAFDYGDLSRSDAEFLREKTGEIRQLARAASESIMLIGAALLDVKARIGHGYFLPWLESEFQWHENTARNFMRVASAFKSTNFVDLQIDASALYLLAAPSTPEPVRQEALKRAEGGERITHANVREMLPPKVERAIHEAVNRYASPPPAANSSAAPLATQKPEPERQPVAPEVLESVPDIHDANDLDMICELERVMKDLQKSGYTPTQIAYFAGELSVPGELFKQTGEFLLEVANAR
jgi:hypothetical protein